jgi:hypothetical protein
MVTYFSFLLFFSSVLSCPSLVPQKAVRLFSSRAPTHKQQHTCMLRQQEVLLLAHMAEWTDKIGPKGCFSQDEAKGNKKEQKQQKQILAGGGNGKTKPAAST